MSKQNLLIIIGAFTPFVVMLASLFGIISYDLAIAIILFTFAPALFPAMLENYRKKQGWSKVSTVTTAAGQIGIAVIFYAMGLMVSFAIDMFLAIAWTVLVIQAFLYSKSEPSVLDRIPKLGDTYPGHELGEVFDEDYQWPSGDEK